MELLDQGLYQPLVKLRDTASGEKYLVPLRPLLDLRVQYNEEWVYKSHFPVFVWNQAAYLNSQSVKCKKFTM